MYLFLKYLIVVIIGIDMTVVIVIDKINIITGMIKAAATGI